MAALQNLLKQSRSQCSADRLYLVGHGGGAHFSCNGFLLEVTQANVSPYIPVKVQQDSVEAGHHPKELSNVIMRLYLQCAQMQADIQAQACPRYRWIYFS